MRERPDRTVTASFKKNTPQRETKYAILNYGVGSHSGWVTLDASLSWPISEKNPAVSITVEVTIKRGSGHMPEYYTKTVSLSEGETSDYVEIVQLTDYEVLNVYYKSYSPKTYDSKDGKYHVIITPAGGSSGPAEP